MTSTNVQLDTVTRIFRADVTVQNLLGYAIGTPDDSSTTGVKVFYFSGPTSVPVVAGDTAARVTVRNADGVGNFTAANQPYYSYPQIVRRAAVSASKRWEWNYPASVKSFSFQVKVFALTAQDHIVPPEVPDSESEPARYLQAPYRRFCSAVSAECVYDVVNVEFKPAATQEERQAAIDLIGGTVEGGLSALNAYYVRIPSDTTGAPVNAAAAKLRLLPQIAEAYPHLMTPVSLDYLRPNDGPNWTAANMVVRDSSADSSHETWALTAINAPRAWGCSAGSPSTVIGVVDHNFRAVPDLGSIYVSPLSQIDAYIASTDPLHGTEIAGIIGAKGNNNAGITGVLWDSRVHVYDMKMEFNAALKHIESAARGGVSVINLSMGIGWSAYARNRGWISSGGYDPGAETNSARLHEIEVVTGDMRHRFLKTVVNLNQGGYHPLFVVSSGNDGIDARFNALPGIVDSVANVIAVGAARDANNGRLAPMVGTDFFGNPFGSNYGPLVRIAAPGQNVRSIGPGDTPVRVTGTSVAAPYVAGVAGLLISFDPRLAQHPDTLIQLLIGGATRGGRRMLNHNVGDSIPVLNAYESLRLAAARHTAPLCGNRVWTDAGKLWVQRDDRTDDREAVADIGDGAQYVSPLHGGRRVHFWNDQHTDQMLVWENGQWTNPGLAPGDTAFDQWGPTYYYGTSHDRDTVTAYNRVGTGLEVGIRERVAPFVNATGHPTFNYGPFKRINTIPMGESSTYESQPTIRWATSTDGGTPVYAGATQVQSMGSSVSAGYRQVTFSRDGTALLVSMSRNSSSTALSEWSRCPGWSNPDVQDYTRSDGTVGQTAKWAECRGVSTSTRGYGTTMYRVPLNGSSIQILYSTAGTTLEFAVPDGTRDEVSVVEQYQDQTSAGAWVPDATSTWRTSMQWTLTTQADGCATLYRNLLTAGTPVLTIPHAGLWSCPSQALSFSPNVLAAGGATLFPATVSSSGVLQSGGVAEVLRRSGSVPATYPRSTPARRVARSTPRR